MLSHCPNIQWWHTAEAKLTIYQHIATIRFVAFHQDPSWYCDPAHILAHQVPSVMHDQWINQNCTVLDVRWIYNVVYCDKKLSLHSFPRFIYVQFEECDLGNVFQCNHFMGLSYQHNQHDICDFESLVVLTNSYSHFQNYTEMSQRFFMPRKHVTCSGHSLDEGSAFCSWSWVWVWEGSLFNMLL